MDLTGNTLQRRRRQGFLILLAFASAATAQNDERRLVQWPRGSTHPCGTLRSPGRFSWPSWPLAVVSVAGVCFLPRLTCPPDTNPGKPPTFLVTCSHVWLHCPLAPSLSFTKSTGRGVKGTERGEAPDDSFLLMKLVIPFPLPLLSLDQPHRSLSLLALVFLLSHLHHLLHGLTSFAFLQSLCFF